ncbi:DUF2750 domain-containing protein [Photobacterium leiognathi]|uniref:DUF2750 domain-containing protein n=1 Tax=Photobacterium leiognathi TaxID=553611 RepID=UPI002734D68D|nr:DUF2750 domain-containing protein [Photobacterium leiognathi]
MSTPLDATAIETIQGFDAEKRYKHLVKEVVANREIWILIDEHGCVMLNTDDEDCVPVWSNKEFAEAWATGEWDNCKAESISLNKWHSRWTHGLEDDELAIVVFPIQDQEGLVIYPDELDYELKNQAKKQR